MKPSVYVFFHDECGAELYVAHDEVRDGLCVRCPDCMRKGTVYIDGDEDGCAEAGVSWAPAEPEEMP